MTALLPSRTGQKRRRFSPLDMFEALATPHGVDRYLELVNPMATVREVRAEVVSVHHTTPSSVALTLRPTRQFTGFDAGQFVNVGVTIDGVRRTRCYSPCNSQYRTDGLIEITVKRHPEGLVSNYLNDHAAVGMVVQLSQADGVFRLPALRPDKIVLISGGSGITPVLSMLRTLCAEGYRGEVVFLHYATAPGEVAHRSDIEKLAAEHGNVRVELAYPETEHGRLRGFFSRTHLDDVAPWAADAQTYLCGPPALMRSVAEVYEKAGIAERLHREEFQPTLVVVAEDGAPTGTVRFGETEASNDGSTLLEQAEAAGLTPEFGCRMGICFSCTQVKTSGCTRNIRTGELNADPDTEIQLCVNVPVGDVAIEL